MQLKYYKNLDGIRAIAALMVMFFHFFRDIEPYNNFIKILSLISDFGQTGVVLFFVLSGFLITRILINTKLAKGYFKNFYVRRTLRIFPLYYLFLLVWYFIAPLFLVMETGSLDQQIFYYTYLEGFARTFNWDTIGPHHFWSLAVEEHFYLLWPLIVYKCSNKNLQYVIISMIVLAFILRMGLLSEGYSVFVFTFTRFDSLAIGAILALLEINNFFRKDNAVKFLLFFGLMIVSTLVVWMALSGEANDNIQNLSYLLLSFTYFAGIGFVLSIEENSLLNKFLKTTALSYTGKISYGLYVYHPLVFLFCQQYIHTQILFVDYIIGFVISYAMASISYHFFESTFLGFKKYFRYDVSS